MGQRRRKTVIEDLRAICKSLAELMEHADDESAWYREPKMCARYSLCGYFPLCYRGIRSDTMMNYDIMPDEDKKDNLEVDNE